jgi:hypothetical protein
MVVESAMLDSPEFQIKTTSTYVRCVRNVPTLIFSDHRHRRGHIRRIQQSTLAGEYLANLCGFKRPAACMTRGGDTSRLAGRERRTHNPQRSTRLAVAIGRSAGSK